MARHCRPGSVLPLAAWAMTEDQLPGHAAGDDIVAAITARVPPQYACKATADACTGTLPESTTCTVAAGVCTAYVAQPLSGSTAPCGTCAGAVNNSCSGVALTPPLQCWTTQVSCCSSGSQCASGGVRGCTCTPTAGAPAFGFRGMCWNAFPAPGGGQPAEPIPLPDPPLNFNGLDPPAKD